MTYFTQDFIQFFTDLAQNNQKEWFHANKKRYESSVKKPFEHFLTDLIHEIQKEESSLEIQPKDCVLRINRDLRFSKDKTPYNLHYSAVVSNAGRKDKSVPGIFLRFTPEEVGIMGGAYVLDKDQLQALRTHIAQDPKKLEKLASTEPFASKFGELKGDESKRMPIEFQEQVKQIPLLSRKQFYFVAKRETALITNENLLTEMMDYWHAMRPINRFLTQIIHP
ncbi:DUF2461 domain-containing protein [Reichenbachiella sp.]|uniref:DUF2461 domain-containing protein n=1 Tax=Reichenbachiella sp. TaxID=2184521 RepID=UPI00329755C6